MKECQNRWRERNPEKIKEKRLKDKDYQKEYFKTYRLTEKYKVGKKKPLYNTQSYTFHRVWNITPGQLFVFDKSKNTNDVRIDYVPSECNWETLQQVYSNMIK